MRSTGNAIMLISMNLARLQIWIKTRPSLLRNSKIPASNISAAGIFRTIEEFTPTLLVDEAETFLKDNEELRGVLNSGHRRRFAAVIRLVGEQHETRIFSTWCPKAIACIGSLPGTLEDRSIVIHMRRKTAQERVEARRQDRLEQTCEPIRRQAARW